MSAPWERENRERDRRRPQLKEKDDGKTWWDRLPWILRYTVALPFCYLAYRARTRR